MDKKKLDIFQILKGGTSFNSKEDKNLMEKYKNEKKIQEKQTRENRQKEQKKRRNSSVDLTFLKFNPSDSESSDEEQEEKEKEKKMNSLLSSKQEIDNISKSIQKRRKKSLDEMEKIVKKKHNQRVDRINLLRKQNKIKVEGDQVPEIVSNFTKLMKKYKIKQTIMDNIKDNSYKRLTPIQMQGIPVGIARRNLLALAPTGSGKTLSYCLPILHNLGEHQKKGIRALIFAPTADLGEQIEREIGYLNYKNSLKIKYIHNINKEIKSFLEQIQNIDVLICTPLKFLKIFKFLIKKRKEENGEVEEDQQQNQIDEIQKQIKGFKQEIIQIKKQFQQQQLQQKESVNQKKKKNIKQQQQQQKQEPKQLSEELVQKKTRIRMRKIKELQEQLVQLQQEQEEQKVLIEQRKLAPLFEDQSKIILENLEYLVFDETDKYFELNMAKQMRQILELFQDNSNLTYMLYSATISFQVEELVKNLINDPIKIQVSGKNNVLNTIEQKLLYCQSEFGKLVGLKNMINQGEFCPPVLIFVQSKERGHELLAEMQDMCLNTVIKVDFIHQDLTQQERQNIINSFRLGKLYVLICTDLMARGIDFKGVNLVINYDFPQTGITYIHRVGRTGRANREGKAVTFYTDVDKPILREIGGVLKSSGCDVPDWILSLKKMDKKTKKHLAKFPVKREHISRDPDLHIEEDKEYDRNLKMADKMFKQEKKKIKRQQKKEMNLAGKQNEKVSGDEGDGWQVVQDDQNENQIQNQNLMENEDGWQIAE